MNTKISERLYESMTDHEKSTRYACICHYADTDMIKTVYVVGVANQAEANDEAYRFFKANLGTFFCTKIKKIEVRERGRGLYDSTLSCNNMVSYY